LRTVERLLDSGDWKVWVLGSRAKVDISAPADRFAYLQCDVRDPAQIARDFATVTASTDRLDALIYSAGVNVAGELCDIDAADAEAMFDVNFRGPWLAIREASPLLRKAGDLSNPSRVVLIGSIGGMRPKIASGIYGATKAAAHVLAQVFAVELGPFGITVNVVAPGTTDTPMIAMKDGDTTGHKLSGQSPLGRIGTVDDSTNAVMFLLGPDAAYVNGAILPVDGGTRAAYINR
jgi:3-oxoacyl-[acyl-carrier protein] reductase